MSQNESYHVNESLRNDLRLRKILEELPEFASRYFYANEFSLSARTRSLTRMIFVLFSDIS